jgi:hypothetical protein
MRPAGEVHLAMLQAAHAIRRERAEAGHGPTLAELVARSQVGYAVARTTVANLKRHGKLEIVATRKVAGRNRPVAEYAPVEPADPDAPVIGLGWVDLGNCLSTWAR